MIFGFVIFFFTIALTSTASIVAYYLSNRASDGNNLIVVFAVLGAIILGAAFCTLCDAYRRKVMVQRPVDMILDVTKKIAAGDFSVKLIPMHEYQKFDEYDLIFENINIMTAELSKNELLKNDFISNVSHEIKTPLAVIQNYAKSLQNSNLNNEKREEYLKGLLVQTQKLSNLITNILKLNKLENQQILPEMEKLDLSELLRLVVLSFEDLLERKGLEFECDIDEVQITSSASLLEIVFNNLISNAVKFTSEGGKIFISLKEDGAYAIVKITDTGCGISPEVGAHIFDKFYQGDKSRALEGNGLGLALVKKVIDVIGGEILVKSKVGEGSTFIIKLKREE